ncbi:MAG: aminotransferase class III-fold pyridoxal phosphate-dependent enzyme [bacterium]|nr:aminotransferase class III-fold pyridoxal phosphate-dependent enzyme [bacterium]
MAAPQNGFVYRERSEKTRALVERDQKSVSPSYTRSYGFAMGRGQGAEVWDVDENHYLDFAAGIAVLSTGHRHPKIMEAIHRQAERYIHIGATDFFCEEQVKLAEKLQKIIPIHHAETPDDILTYCCNSGTEAVEAALKLARYQEPNRGHVIAFYGGFHGRTMGALSVTASKAIQRSEYPFIPGGVEHIPYPAKSSCSGDGCCSSCWCDSARFIEDFIIKKKIPGDEIAAIIVEPIQGEGGYILPRDDFFPKIRQLCDKYGILLIVDEIQSGMGRTGKWLAVEHWDVKPDIVCLAKGLGSGFPIGAIVAHRDVMGKWVPGAHASTFGGNPLACAVAAATIEVMEGEGLLENAHNLGDYTLERLSRFKLAHPSIKRVEGKGLMIGVEFADAQGNPVPGFRDQVVDQCFMNGLIMLGCGASTIRIAPPLVINQQQMADGLDIFERSIAEVEEEYWEKLGQA